MLAEQTLTRNESADLVQKKWSTMVKDAPSATREIRVTGAAHYIACAGVVNNLGEMHKDHHTWLAAMLDDGKALRLADELAAAACEAAGSTWPDDERVQRIWSTMVENAPSATAIVRRIGMARYASTLVMQQRVDTSTISRNDAKWLITAWSNNKVLDLADEFAAAARKAADPTRPTMVVSGNGKDAFLMPVFWRDQKGA